MCDVHNQTQIYKFWWISYHLHKSMYFIMTWCQNKFYSIPTNAKKFHTRIMPINKNNLKFCVSCWRARVTCQVAQHELFSTTIDCAISLWRYACFMESLFLSWHNVNPIKYTTTCNDELCISFQDRSTFNQLCLDLDSSKSSFLASILLLRVLEFYAKNS